MKKPKNKNTKAYQEWELQQLRKACLNLWKEVVKFRAGSRCEIPGCVAGPKGLQGHHILDEKLFIALRYDPENGVCACPKNHKLGKESFHKNPIFAYEFLSKMRPASLCYLKEHCHDELIITKEYLVKQIVKLEILKETYKKIQ